MFLRASAHKCVPFEKKMPFCGLLIDGKLLQRNDIFSSRQVGDTLHYVYITQMLQSLERDIPFPFPAYDFDDLDYPYLIWPEFYFWQRMYINSKSHPDKRVREKCANTAGVLEAEYPRTARSLYESNFNLSLISPVDWTTVARRFPDDYSFANKPDPVEDIKK